MYTCLRQFIFIFVLSFSASCIALRSRLFSLIHFGLGLALLSLSISLFPDPRIIQDPEVNVLCDAFSIQFPFVVHSTKIVTVRDG